VDTLKDIWASIVVGSKERTTNPLTVAFLLSWATWNYKFFVVLTGDGTTSERLAAIKTMYPSGDPYTYAGGALLYPLGTALLYVFVYPFFSQGVIKFYRRRQVAIANSIKEVEMTRVLTHKEAAQLTRRHESARTEWHGIETSLHVQLSELRDALALSEKQLEQSQQKGPTSKLTANTDKLNGIPTFKEEEEEEEEEEEDKPHFAIATKSDTISVPGNLSGSSLKKLLVLSEVSSGIGAKDIANKFDENYSITLTDLEELRMLALVKKNGLNRWELTPEGRIYAVGILKQLKLSNEKAQTY
jgi:hypothetical protein